MLLISYIIYQVACGAAGRQAHCSRAGRQAHSSCHKCQKFCTMKQRGCHMPCRIQHKSYILEAVSSTICHAEVALTWLPGEEVTKQAHQARRSSCIEAFAQQSTVPGGLSPDSSWTFRPVSAWFGRSTTFLIRQGSYIIRRTS